MDLSKQKKIYEALCEHFNHRFEPGEDLLFPDFDNYDDEWVIWDKDIEIVDKKVAIRNEKEMVDEPNDLVGLYNILQTNRIGVYRRLAESNYYYRWI